MVNKYVDRAEYSSALNISKIKENLNTKYFGKNIVYFNTIASTQDEAKKAINNNIQDGSIIIADMQTNGRGTHGRIWHTDKNKNILMTIILYPKVNIDKLDNITIKIAECILKTIKLLYGYELKIKDPNDIILNNKKLGGILTETTCINKTVNNMIIGIGLNINQENFSEEIIDVATSLKKEFEKDFSREDIIATFLSVLEEDVISSLFLN